MDKIHKRIKTDLVLEPIKIWSTRYSGIMQFKDLNEKIPVILLTSDEDKISLVTATSTTPQESLKTLESIGIESFLGPSENVGRQPQQKLNGGRTFCYHKRKSCNSNGIFSAPPGVNSHHVKFSSIRRHTGGPRLIFVWPQKIRRGGRFLSLLAPFMHGVLIGLICLDMIHFWPGELLPNCLPSTSLPPQPPVKCNVIEPLWCDNS